MVASQNLSLESFDSTVAVKWKKSYYNVKNSKHQFSQPRKKMLEPIQIDKDKPFKNYDLTRKKTTVLNSSLARRYRRSSCCIKSNKSVVSILKKKHGNASTKKSYTKFTSNSNNPSSRKKERQNCVSNKSDTREYSASPIQVLNRVRIQSPRTSRNGPIGLQENQIASSEYRHSISNDSDSTNRTKYYIDGYRSSQQQRKKNKKAEPNQFNKRSADLNIIKHANEGTRTNHHKRETRDGEEKNSSVVPKQKLGQEKRRPISNEITTKTPIVTENKRSNLTTKTTTFDENECIKMKADLYISDKNTHIENNHNITKLETSMSNYSRIDAQKLKRLNIYKKQNQVSKLDLNCRTSSKTISKVHKNHVSYLKYHTVAPFYRKIILDSAKLSAGDINQKTSQYCKSANDTITPIVNPHLSVKTLNHINHENINSLKTIKEDTHKMTDKNINKIETNSSKIKEMDSFYSATSQKYYELEKHDIQMGKSNFKPEKNMKSCDTFNTAFSGYSTLLSSEGFVLNHICHANSFVKIKEEPSVGCATLFNTTRGQSLTNLNMEKTCIYNVYSNNLSLSHIFQRNKDTYRCRKNQGKVIKSKLSSRNFVNTTVSSNLNFNHRYHSKLKKEKQKYLLALSSTTLDVITNHAKQLKDSSKLITSNSILKTPDKNIVDKKISYKKLISPNVVCESVSIFSMNRSENSKQIMSQQKIPDIKIKPRRTNSSATVKGKISKNKISRSHSKLPSSTFIKVPDTVKEDFIHKIINGKEDDNKCDLPLPLLNCNKPCKVVKKLRKWHQALPIPKFTSKKMVKIPPTVVNWNQSFPKPLIDSKKMVEVPATTVMNLDVHSHPDNEECVCCSCPSRRYMAPKYICKEPYKDAGNEGDTVIKSRKSICIDTKRKHRPGIIDDETTTGDTGSPVEIGTQLFTPHKPPPAKSAFHLRKYKRDELKKRKIKFEKKPPTLKEIEHMTETELKIKFKAPYVYYDDMQPINTEFKRSVRDKKKISDIYPWLEDPSVGDTGSCMHICCRCPDPYSDQGKGRGSYPLEPELIDPYRDYGRVGPKASGAPTGKDGQGPIGPESKGAYGPTGVYGRRQYGYGWSGPESDESPRFGARGKFPSASHWQTPLGSKPLPKGWPPPGWVPPGWTPSPDIPLPPWRAPLNWIPPVGWTPPPGSRPPEGWVKPSNWPPLDGSLPLSPILGRIPPDGWVPMGWNPPPGQKRVLWNPPEDWVPPPGWTPPPGSTPPVQFIPPAGWVPPGWTPPPGQKERVEWTPPPKWIPPPDWTPPAGSKPPVGYVAPYGAKPPASFYPPEGWVPPGWKPSPAFKPPPKWIPPPLWIPPPDWKPPKGSQPPKSWMPPKGWIPDDWTPKPGEKVTKWTPPSPIWFLPKRWIPPEGASPPPVTIIPPQWEPPDRYKPPVQYLSPPPEGYYFDYNDKLQKTKKFDRAVLKQAKIDERKKAQEKKPDQEYILKIDQITGKVTLEEKKEGTEATCTETLCICQPKTEEELKKSLGSNICEQHLCTCEATFKKDVELENARIHSMEMAARDAYIWYQELKRKKMKKIVAELEPIRRKELQALLKKSITDKRAKLLVTCVCPKELPIAEVIKSYNSDFRAKFRDKVRLVDFILVFKDDGDLPSEEMAATYLTGALKLGLELEMERGVMPHNNQLVFVKFHAPAAVVEKYGRAFGIRKFFRRHHVYCVPQPERELIQIVRETYPKPTMYSTHDRSMIVNEMLLHLPYGTNTNDYGYHNLMRKNIVRDGFALHDGPHYFVNKQVADKAQMRQILYYNWAAYIFPCFRSCPSSLLQEYMGERVAMFFSFYSYYNTWLFVLACIAFVTSIFNVVSIYLYSGIYNAVNYVCRKPFADLYLCPLCTDFNHCPLKSYAKDYCVSNAIDNIIDNSSLTLEFYSISVLLWAVLMAYGWKSKERKLSWLWECSTATSNSQVNRLSRRMPYIMRTFDERTVFILKMIGSYFVIFFILAFYLLLVHFWTHRYRRAKEFYIKSKLLPKYDPQKELEKMRLMILLFSGLGFAFMSVVMATVTKHVAYVLTYYENHSLFCHYERSMVIKIFIINCITTFPLLFFHTFIRGQGYIMPIHKAQFMKWEWYYDICGPYKLCLHEIMIVYCGMVIIKQFVAPFIWWTTRLVTCDKTCCNRYPVWEKEYLLPNVTEKMIMDRYDYLFDQFAYLVIFGIIFPLATIPCLLCNCYDYSYTAKLFLIRHRRPLLPRYGSVGTVRGVLLVIAFAAIWFHGGIIVLQTKLAERHVYRAVTHTYPNKTYMDYLGVMFPTAAYIFDPGVDPQIKKDYRHKNVNDTTSEIPRSYLGSWFLSPIQTTQNFYENVHYCFAPTQARMGMYLPAYRAYIKDFHQIHGIKYPQRWQCGSECYIVPSYRSRIFILYVFSMHAVIWFLLCLFGTSSRVRQVRVAETKILNAIIRGDRRRNRQKISEGYNNLCPHC